MRNIFSRIIVIGLCVISSGCSKSDTEQTPTPVTPVDQVPAVSQIVTTQTVEVGCGSCIFDMDGVSGCQLAVKIDQKPYLVSGSDIDAHTAGLCAGAKQAEVAGKIEGGKFVVSRMELKP